MPVAKLAALFAGAVLLSACEARIGNDAPPVEANASAAGKAEEGRLTVSAPGFNMSIDIPEGLRSDARMDGDNDLIYPGANFGGIHVQGTPEASGGDHDGEVELRFTTADPAARVVAWYRDPARAGDFTVQSATRDGNAVLLSGTGRREGERFTLRLTPRGPARKAGWSCPTGADIASAWPSALPIPRKCAPISSPPRRRASRSLMPSCSSISATPSRGRRCASSASCSATSIATPPAAASRSSPCSSCARATAFPARAGGSAAAARERGYQGPWEGPQAARFIAAVQAETFAWWQSRNGTAAVGARD